MRRGYLCVASSAAHENLQAIRIHLRRPPRLLLRRGRRRHHPRPRRQGRRRARDPARDHQRPVRRPRRRLQEVRCALVAWIKETSRPRRPRPPQPWPSWSTRNPPATTARSWSDCYPGRRRRPGPAGDSCQLGEPDPPRPSQYPARPSRRRPRRVETPSRKNAGAHYTPRSLAEEVVLHALQPLVYEPGPLQTNDENQWRLKSASAILDLKVADIAAGSGAFLVAAARYLSERLVEAWIAEGMLDEPLRPTRSSSVAVRVREVIARCLYGADINPMAVEMCKLSLWLVSHGQDEAVLVRRRQDLLRKLAARSHLARPVALPAHRSEADREMQQQILVSTSTLRSPRRPNCGTSWPVRSRNATRCDLREPRQDSCEQFRQATADLRLIADGIIAAGLPLGGKPGRAA